MLAGHSPTTHSHLNAHGYVVLSLIPPTDPLLNAMSAEADRLLASVRAGARDALNKSPLFAEFATSRAVRDIVEPVLSPTAFVARSIVFDKNPNANWDVAWHQDTTIAVTQRIDAPGFGPWSAKSGVPHVQPPAGVLARMLTLRLHLDDCSRDNGALWVVPGSHEPPAILPDTSVDAATCERNAAVCECAAGDVLLMRPLLLHASKRAVNPSHRRILHLEFAADSLPQGLEWARL